GRHHDVNSWSAGCEVTRIVSTRLRRPASDSTVNVRCSTSTTDPLVGILPKFLANNPPTVSTSSSSSNNNPKASEKSDTDIAALTKNSPSGCGITSAISASSYSSSISPTSSSIRSSSVTNPAVPPYSSMTIAAWIASRGSSCNTSQTVFASGTTGISLTNRF